MQGWPGRSQDLKLLPAFNDCKNVSSRKSINLIINRFAREFHQAEDK